MVQKIRIRLSHSGAEVLDGNVAIITDQRTPDEIVRQLRSMIDRARSQFGAHFQFDLVDEAPPAPSVRITEAAGQMTGIQEVVLDDTELAAIFGLRAHGVVLTPENFNQLQQIMSGSMKLVPNTKPAKPKKAAVKKAPAPKKKAAPKKGKKLET